MKISAIHFQKLLNFVKSATASKSAICGPICCVTLQNDITDRIESLETNIKWNNILSSAVVEIQRVTIFVSYKMLYLLSVFIYLCIVFKCQHS